MRNVSSYFAPVSKEMHLGLQHETNLKEKEKNLPDKEKKEAKKEAKRKERKAIHARILAKYHRSNELRKSGRDAVTYDDPVKWYIDEIICDELVEEEDENRGVQEYIKRQLRTSDSWTMTQYC